MAVKLFIDEQAGRLVQSPRTTAALAGQNVFKGDDRTYQIYLLRRTGLTFAPYEYSDRSGWDVKFAIGRKSAIATSGTWTLDGETLQPNATAAEVQTALRTSQGDNSLTVAGSMASGFTVTWGAVGAEVLLVGDVSQLLPVSYLTIEERRVGDGSTREQQFIRVRQNPVVFEDTWSNLATTVTPTVTETQAGSSTLNEIQTVSYSPEPISGQQTFTMPADTRTVTAAVVAGVFTTTTNHGFVVNQPIVPSAFSNVDNFANGTTYFVEATATRTTFTIKATLDGEAITTATADAGTATITTVAEVTAPFAYNATIDTVQAALQALSCIGTSNVAVSGIAGERYAVQFAGDKGLAQLPLMTVQAGGLVAPFGKTAEINFATYELADLLDGAESATANLEIEFSETGSIETVVSQSVEVREELIQGGTLSPVGFTTLDVLTIIATSPAEITADEDDYTVTLSPVLRLSSDAARTITGLAGGVAGRSLTLINVGDHNITLARENASSTAGNRFLPTGTAGDFVVLPNAAAALWYDAVTERWRVL